MEKRVTVLEDKLKSLKSLDDKGSVDSQAIDNKKLDKEQKRKLGQGLRQNKHFSQNKFADEIILRLMPEKLFKEWAKFAEINYDEVSLYKKSLKKHVKESLSKHRSNIDVKIKKKCKGKPEFLLWIC